MPSLSRAVVVGPGAELPGLEEREEEQNEAPVTQE